MKNAQSNTPQIRFPNFSEPWIENSLSQLFEEISNKIGEKKIETYSITAGKGFVSQKKKFGKDISGTQNKNYTHLLPGDFSYNKGNSKSYKYGCVYLNNFDFDIAVPNVFISFRSKANDISNDFFQQLFMAHKLDRGLRRIISSTARMDGLLNVNKNNFFKLKVTYPKLIEEQEEISEFLIQVDKWIENQKKQAFSLTEYKKGVVQKLFTQEIRFRNESGDDYPTWVKKHLGELFLERNVKNGGKNYQLLSVKIHGGVVLQGDTNKTDSSNSDKSKYKVVRVGDIAYNTMRMWQGASGVSQYEGIVSPAYTVVYPKNGDSNFYGYLFKHPRTIFNFYRYSQGLTSDTWNLKFQHFSEVEVTVPSDIEEQKKIATFLSSIDELIKHKEKQIALAEQWKKGLLQQMFV